MATTTDHLLVRSDEIVDRCCALDAEIARLEAEKAALLGERVCLLLEMVRPGADGFEQAERSMFAEVSAALHITRGAATKALTVGWALQDRFPATLAALTAGEISVRHATVIVDSSAPLDLMDADAHARYEETILPYAAAETAARTAAFAKSVVATISPETVVERQDRAREGRNVTISDGADGMSWLTLHLPSPLAHAAYDRAARLARGIRMTRAAQDCGAFRGREGGEDHDDHGIRGGEPLTDYELERLSWYEDAVDEHGETLTDDRTLDQIRADVLADLLLTATTDSLDAAGLGGIRGTVQVTIAATTLAGMDDRPAELDGYGPIHPDLARSLAGDAAHWARLFLNPAGMLRCTDSYTPTDRMKQQLRARDRHCRFPGCRMPARVCQIDHNHDHACGGPTDLDNLACFCEGHHALKHPDLDERWRWKAIQEPGGVIVWISPTGREYRDAAPPRVQFA